MKQIIEYIKNIISYIRKDRRLALISLGVIVALILIVIGRVKPPQSNNESNTNNSNFNVKKEEQIIWEDTGAIPGVSEYPSVRKDIEGTYKGKEKYKDYIVQKYENLDAFHDTIDVGVDRNQVIQFVYVTVGPYKVLNVSEYITRFDLDSPDIIKDVKDLSNHEAWVYLDEGVMFYVQKTKRTVYSEMYFDPMTKQEFDNFWGNNKLTNEFEFPEDKMR